MGKLNYNITAALKSSNKQNLRAVVIPPMLHTINLRAVMEHEEWDILRKQVYADAGHVCDICSNREQLHCHEEWLYRISKGVQVLNQLICVCETCHKHIHFFGMLRDHSLAEIANYYTDINDWSLDKSYKYLSRQRNGYGQLLNIKWKKQTLKPIEQYGFKRNEYEARSKKLIAETLKQFGG